MRMNVRHVLFNLHCLALLSCQTSILSSLYYLVEHCVRTYITIYMILYVIQCIWLNNNINADRILMVVLVVECLMSLRVNHAKMNDDGYKFNRFCLSVNHTVRLYSDIVLRINLYMYGLELTGVKYCRPLAS